MNKRWFVAGSIALSAMTFSGVASAEAATTYTVQSGDSLYKIAQRLGVSLTALEASNPQITKADSIWVGESLVLPAMPQQAKVNAILATAKSLQGIHYQWGGQSPSTGFDCSGFVSYVYAQNGITLPRMSHDQASAGTFVPASQLQPGDLVFFVDTYSNSWSNNVTHVGIYLGGGNMIESSSSHNNIGVVTVKNFWASPYYNTHYWGARRIIPNV